MVKEQNLFVVSEDENLTEDKFVVAEDPRAHSFEIGEKKEETEDTNWRTSKHPKHFMPFLINEFNRIIKPAQAFGSKSMLEKAFGQYKQLDSYISQALRSDYDDHIDVKKLDEIRKIVDSYKDQVENALAGIEKMTKQKRQMRRRGEDESEDMVKEAGTPTMNGLQVQMSAFERAIVGAIINGVVSGGKNIEELYNMANKKYKFSEREELALLQILADMGYPVFKDRLMLGEKVDPTKSDELGEWQANYYA